MTECGSGQSLACSCCRELWGTSPPLARSVRWSLALALEPGPLTSTVLPHSQSSGRGCAGPLCGVSVCGSLHHLRDQPPGSPADTQRLQAEPRGDPEGKDGGRGCPVTGLLPGEPPPPPLPHLPGTDAHLHTFSSHSLPGLSPQNYEHLFKVNDKSVGGSFYLQSKVSGGCTAVASGGGSGDPQAVESLSIFIRGLQALRGRLLVGWSGQCDLLGSGRLDSVVELLGDWARPHLSPLFAGLL